jgi:predicted small integral membrane protein
MHTTPMLSAYQEPALPPVRDIPDNTWILSTIVIVGGILALLAIYIHWKNKRVTGDYVFRASRMTRGNRIFPAQVIVTSGSVTVVKPQWIGKFEESAHIAHISSIQIDTNMVFSDVLIETTGGHNPMVCHGHTKGDAVKMKQVIEQFQSAYFKSSHN